MSDDVEEPSKVILKIKIVHFELMWNENEFMYFAGQSFFIFGRDVAQIPCFRNSFLYGISGGIGVGVLAFLGTSRPHLATHIGFGTFFCGTMVYWMACRWVVIVTGIGSERATVLSNAFRQVSVVGAALWAATTAGGNAPAGLVRGHNSRTWLGY